MYVFFVHNNFFLVACFVSSSREVTFRIALVAESIDEAAVGIRNELAVVTLNGTKIGSMHAV
jgi:hypothetical protein